MRTRLIAAGLVVVMAAGGAWWWQGRRAEQAAAARQVQYVEAPVRHGQIRSTIQGSGPVTAVSGMLVKAPQAATVASVHVRDGDRVEAGQVVVLLESEQLQASLKQAQSEYQNSLSALEALLSPQSTTVRAQQLKAESARLTLEQRRQDVAGLSVTAPQAGVVTSVRAAAGGSVTAGTLLFTIYDEVTPSLTFTVSQEAAAAIRPGQQAVVEMPGLGALPGTVELSGGVATPAGGNRDASVPVRVALSPMAGIRPGMVGQVRMEVPGLTYLVRGSGAVDNDSLEIRAQAAGTAGRPLVLEGQRVEAGALLLRLTNESLMLQLAQAENDLALQEQSLQALLNPSGEPGGQLQAARQRLEQAQHTLTMRRREADELTVRAPVSGTISAVSVKGGERLAAGANLFRVADYTAMQVTISVDELDIAKARVGQRATVTLDALPGQTFQGQVLKINPEGIFKNDIATFEVTVLIDKQAGLMAGMNSTVSIVVTDAQGLWVPAQAVQVRQGTAYVQVLEGGQPVQKEITIGARTSTQVEIAGGLKEGDMVIQTIVRPNQQGLNSILGGQRQPNQTTFPQSTRTPQGR